MVRRRNGRWFGICSSVQETCNTRSHSVAQSYSTVLSPIGSSTWTLSGLDIANDYSCVLAQVYMQPYDRALQIVFPSDPDEESRYYSAAEHGFAVQRPQAVRNWHPGLGRGSRWVKEFDAFVSALFLRLEAAWDALVRERLREPESFYQPSSVAEYYAMVAAQQRALG